MDLYFKQITLVIVATLVVGSRGQFFIQPSNTYGIQGRNVTLQCALDGSSILVWSQPDGQNVADSASGVYSNFVDKYDLTNSGSTYALTIKGIQLSDSGTYKCTHLQSTGNAFAEVIVLESDEVACSENSQVGGFDDNVEGETVTLECQMSYSGLWAPIQDWKWSNGVMINPNNATSATNVVYDNTYITSRDFHGQTWVVSTRFLGPPDGALPEDDLIPPTNYYSRVAPTFSDTFTSSAIIIYYGTDVSTMSLTPEQEVYNPGDKILCAAEGNPEPTLKWVDENNVTIVESGELEITADMVGSHSWKCWAENAIRGNTLAAAAEISFNVTIPPTTTSTLAPTQSGTEDTGGLGGSNEIPSEPAKNDSSGLSDGAIAGIVLGVLAFLIILAIILFFCCVRKAPQKKQEKTKPIAPVSTIPTDHIRSGPPKPMDNLSYVSEKSPPSPYNPYNPYAIPNSHHSPSPYEANNLHYADLALDDTPRSRKPIQVYEPTDYADIRRV